MLLSFRVAVVHAELNSAKASQLPLALLHKALELQGLEKDNGKSRPKSKLLIKSLIVSFTVSASSSLIIPYVLILILSFLCSGASVPPGKPHLSEIHQGGGT